MNTKKIKVSVVIPVFNEESTIISILKKINEQNIPNIDIEIIIINDGSTDNSLKIIEQNSNLYSKLINLKINKGKGGAVREGLKSASGEFILFQDADLEYDPSEYPILFRPILELDADIVMGSRLMSPPLTRVYYFWNKVGNRCITLLFDILHNTTLTDIYSGYIVFRKELLNPNNLRTDGWEQQAEILSKIVKDSRKIYEVPITYYGRTYEEGKKIKPKDVIKIIGTIIREKIYPTKN